VGQATTLFVLVVGGVLAVPVADRLRVPHPVLCAGWGMAVALLPGTAQLRISPELMLGTVLPPLLYAAAYRTSWRQFTAHARPILVLAVVLVIVTAVTVAVAASVLRPSLPVAAAVVLGALVSPPDPAAATTVAARLGLPQRLVTILEGEGLFNDVTALTLYQVMVFAVVTGSLRATSALGLFGYSVVLAVLAGLGTGWVSSRLLDGLPSGTVRAALSLLIPFGAYLPTAALHGSGVLAVLTTALYLGHTRAYADATSRVTGRTFWEVIELLVTCLTFGLVGLELVTVIRAVGNQAGRLLGFAGIICAVVIAVRVMWLVPGTALARRRARPGSADEQVPGDWRGTVVVSWAGMRGVVTVASALAVPRLTRAGTPFPGRDQIIFVAVAVVLVTLIVQGISLPWLITWLGVRVDPAAARAAEQHAATIALAATESRLDQLKNEGVPDDIAERAGEAARILLADVSPEEEQAAEAQETQQHRQLRAAETELLAAARSAVIAARINRSVDPDAADRLIQRLDLRTLAT
jgi:CPA1 family monovalent cation:H+ antiporter